MFALRGRSAAAFCTADELHTAQQYFKFSVASGLVSERAKLKKRKQKKESPGNGHLRRPEKLRILCLHGFGQSAAEFRKKTGALRKKVKGVAEFTFINAPHLIPECEHSRANGLGDRFGWWRFDKNAPKDEHGHGLRYVGWERSIDFLKAFVIREGPFDGVLGFSQGAAMCGVLSSSNCAPFDSFKFAICFSGFVPRDERLQGLMQRGAAPPGFHCLGDGDEIIEKSRSLELLQLMHGSGASTASTSESYGGEENQGKIISSVVHDGGHFIPSTPIVRGKFKEFLVDLQHSLLS